MVCRNFILPEFCKPCLFLSAFLFAKLIVPYLSICETYCTLSQTRYKRPTDSKKGGISAATFYASDTLPALLFLEFVQMCAQDLPVAVCESCHRLFVPFSSRAKYCERVLDPETGATCKDIAAKLAYAEELKANKAKELYNKMRNRYQMRCSRAPGNQKMRDDYNAWRKQAQMALSKYQLGEISWEEFERVMRRDRKVK